MAKYLQNWIIFILIVTSLLFCVCEDADNSNAIGDEAMQFVENNENANEDSENFIESDINHEKNNETCIACKSTIDPTCATNTTFGSFEECPLLGNDRCYHMIKDGKHKRGCLNNLPEEEFELCKKNGDECKVCAEINCNSKPSFVKCLSCHRSKDPQCAINPQDANRKICKSYNDQCFTYIQRFDITRGCVNEKGDSFIEQCNKDPNKCAICLSETEVNGCNNQVIKMETCLECDSDIDPRCRDDPEVFQDKICSHLIPANQAGCYLKVFKTRYERGCIRDLKESARTKCLNQSGMCKSCKGKNCNRKKKFQECIHCNSRDNYLCSLKGMVKTSRPCKNYLSSCLIGIDAHGNTHRRCSREIIDDEIEFPNKQMSVCTTSNCNTDIYPPNRLQCYRCEGDIEDCDFIPSNSTDPVPKNIPLEPCGILSKFDQCYAYLSEDNIIYRGCLTDTSDHRLLCEKDDPNKKDLCLKCRASGCNNVAKVRPPSLSCIHCDKSAECAFGQDKKKATLCKSDVTFGAYESCYTHHSSDGSWAERGCTLDRETAYFTKENTDIMRMCSKSGCNTENVIQSECVSCKSAFNGKCAIISDTDIDTYIKKCEGTYSHEKRGCYTMLKNETVHRGCTKDLSKVDYEACQKKENCDLCTDDNCNIKVAGSSNRITVNVLVIAFIIWNISRSSFGRFVWVES